MTKFNANTDDFDIQNALVMAKASEAAYSNKIGEIRKEMRAFGFKKSKLIDRNETQCVVTANDDAVVVAFRGTEGKIADFESDAKFFLTGGPLGGKVHEGFMIALNQVWLEVQAAIENYRTKNQGVWFTGHSLGAALATLATAKFLERAKPVRGLYTFGSPRVGNEDFAKDFNHDFNARTFRFVNNTDIVTRVPPRFPFGYRHVGGIYYFEDDGDLSTNPSRWGIFVDRVKTEVKDVFSPNPGAVKDHFMANYIDAIQGWIDRG